MSRTFLDLLWSDAPRGEYDALLAEMLADPGAADGPDAERLRGAHARALALRERMAAHRGREAELAALNETAGDLTAIRDLDRVLGTIVRRARRLLRADMTYLSLNDEAEGASYMRVTDGALTSAFGRLRLPLGTGLLGLVAQAGAPYFTEDYQADERFVHREFIDSAVAGEQIRAILGVPLLVDGEVIGALLAVHRVVRPFPPGEVALLTSFAAHAAVALENARLFEQAQAANAELRLRNDSVERAALAHDRLTDALVAGGGVEDVARVLEETVGARVTVLDPDGTPLAGAEPGPDDLAEAVGRARATGRSVNLPDGGHVAVAAAGEEHLGTLVVGARDLSPAERRTLERGAVAVALVLLFARTEAEAEDRVRGDLLRDLLAATVGPDGAVDGVEGARLTERARRQGLTLDGDWALAVTVTDDPRRDARRAAALATARGGLSAVHDGAVVVAVPAAAPLDLGRALAAALGDTTTVGVGVGAPGPAYGEARRCHDALLALGRRGEVAEPRSLGLARLVLGGGGPADLADFVETTLGPVLAYDAAHGTALLDTMERWYAAGGGLRRTADLLHVHPNTVAQRLDRITAVLGHDWRDPAGALDLQLALRLHRLRGV